MNLPTCTYLHAPIHMHLPTCTYLHAPTHIHLPTCTHLHAPTFMHLHIPTCTYMHLNAPTCTYMFLLYMHLMYLCTYKLHKFIHTSYFRTPRGPAHRRVSLPGVLHTGEFHSPVSCIPPRFYDCFGFITPWCAGHRGVSNKLEYLREFEKFCKTVSGCSSGAQMCLIHEKK